MDNVSSVAILNHIMIAISKKGGGRVTVTDLFLFQEGRSSADDLAESLRLGLVEPCPDKIRAVRRWMWTGRRGGEGFRWGGGILEVKQRVRIVIQSVGDAHGRCGSNIHMVASVRG